MPIPLNTPVSGMTSSPHRRWGWFVLSVTIILACGVGVFFFYRMTGRKVGGGFGSGDGTAKRVRMIQEEVVLPQTSEVTPTEGQYFASEAVAVPLLPPANEEIVLPNPAHTIKEAYALVEPQARAWAPDAKLHFIRSLSAVTPQGACSAWQMIFASRQRGRGYEILVEGDHVASLKEIASTAQGADIPREWYDSGEAVQSIAHLPQFASSTLSGLTFFYNPDAQEWRYGLATTFGNTSMRVR